MYKKREWDAENHRSLPTSPGTRKKTVTKNKWVGLQMFFFKEMFKILDFQGLSSKVFIPHYLFLFSSQIEKNLNSLRCKLQFKMKLTFAAVLVCLLVGCVFSCEHVTQGRVREALAAWALGRCRSLISVHTLNNATRTRAKRGKGS